MKDITCGFIGLGLIGGSIAKAIKTFRPEIKIIATDVREETLLLARREGIADETVSDIDEHFTTCDFIFLCAPVSDNDKNLLTVKKYLSERCILTDVGSVKLTTMKQMKAAGLSHCFVGGHPMAGSERIGFSNSHALLLQNAYYMLTPSEDVPSSKVDELRCLIQDLGAIPMVLSAEEHDRITAGISHLPHIIASCLVNFVKENDTQDKLMKQIAAGGFKDITRIASSSPDVWQQICLTNADNITKMLNLYIDALLHIKELLSREDADALYSFFDTARTFRDSFSTNANGSVTRIYDFTVNIADKPGALASIINLLSEHDISIKNIGITHSRERAEGALRLEFYNETSLTEAREVLTRNQYHII